MTKFAVAIHDLALETHHIDIVEDNTNHDSAIVIAVVGYLHNLPEAEKTAEVEEAIKELLTQPRTQPLKALLTDLELSVAVLEI